jgi:pimeloyl-ACP methyl ester carboxylesterase
MPFVQTNGIRTNYVQIDCESGNDCEDLVMVHGLATNLAFWYIRYVSAFSKRYRVTLYDLRGHGRSSITDSGYTPKNMAVDLQQLLDHLVVALNLACLNPDHFASLVLADTHISIVRRVQKTKNWEFGKRIQPILEQHSLDVDVREPYFGYRLLSAVAHLQIQNVEISQELEDLVSPLMGNNSKRTANQWLKLMGTTQAEKELMGDDGLSLDRLRKLNFPILAMYGEYSQAMSTGEQLLEVWPHADFRQIRGAGHFFPITRSSELMENCRQFWNGS